MRPFAALGHPILRHFPTSRRGLSAKIKQVEKQLQEYERRTWQRGQLGCLLWNDVRPVVFLSTHRRVDQLTLYPASDWRPDFDPPTVAVAVGYNFNEGHVDKVDQLRAYDVVQRRGRRTWPALA